MLQFPQISMHSKDNALLEGARLFEKIAPDVEPGWHDLLLTSAGHFRAIANVFQGPLRWHEVFAHSEQLDNDMQEAFKTHMLTLGLLGRGDVRIPEILQKQSQK